MSFILVQSGLKRCTLRYNKNLLQLRLAKRESYKMEHVKIDKDTPCILDESLGTPIEPRKRRLGLLSIISCVAVITFNVAVYLYTR